MYEAVKRRLDYQVALQNARKDFERTNMINWITNEVKKSITAKQEQDALQACLNQLRQIASFYHNKKHSFICYDFIFIPFSNCRI
jgi:hypothetical protein